MYAYVCTVGHHLIVSRGFASPFGGTLSCTWAKIAPVSLPLAIITYMHAAAGFSMGPLVSVQLCHGCS